MVRRLELPIYTPPNDGVIPPQIIEQISNRIVTFSDLMSFSLMNKNTYNHVMNNNRLWMKYLKKINVWYDKKQQLEEKGTVIENSVDDYKLTPLNCMNYKIKDPNLAAVTFIKIYSTLSPIVKQLLVENYTNFQTLAIFNEFNTPSSQAKLFSNIGGFLAIYNEYTDYKNLIIRFTSILNLFINSLILEISIQLKEKHYKTVLSLITALDYLNISNDDIKIDPLESLLEFFIGKYNEDYSYLLGDDLSNQCFIKEDDESTKRGVVNGFSFNFNKIDEILASVEKLLNTQLGEINSIFRDDSTVRIEGRDVDEIPIVLKILENFLSNHLIGGLFDRVISKSRHIDSLEESPKPVHNNLDIQDITKDINNSCNSNDLTGNGANTHIDNRDDIDSDNQDNPEGDVRNFPHINIMNEQSLFFQCVPYIYSKSLVVLQNLKYPKTEIILDDKEKTKMNYVKVVCEFVNYYYEQYLIDFSNELPQHCHTSLIQLINAWQTNNQKIQKSVENEILKLVDEEDDDNKKFNFEIFTNFASLFTFKTKSEEIDAEVGNSEEGNNGKEEADEVKLTKMAAKLKILVGKVESLKTLVSIDLTVLLLQHIKNSYDLLLGLTKYSITEQLNKQIFQTCTNIFNDMLNILINNHIKPGFVEALQRLKNYKPINLNQGGADYSKKHTDGTLEPVNNFIELVDVGDLILQMITVFYDRELIQNGIIPAKNIHSRDFLRMNNVEKSIKLLETTLDTYVANGLDISIDIIISEIRFKVEECVGPIPLYSNKYKSSNSTLSTKTKYRPQPPNQSQVPPLSSSSTITTTGTTQNSIVGIESAVYNYGNIEALPLNEGHTSEWCNICLEVLKSHFGLLQDSIDRSIMDVFKQELGDRLITLLIQLLMKKFKISVIGGIQFSYDINSLYSYYQINRIKPAIEYLIGFKKIDQLYLIDCSGRKSQEFKAQCKELGKLIIDIGRENGVYTPEEVYQFVSRRSDWDRIKRNVDKVVYGFGAEDCVIV